LLFFAILFLFFAPRTNRAEHRWLVDADKGSERFLIKEENWGNLNEAAAPADLPADCVYLRRL
jgi:hypothetical protein